MIDVDTDEKGPMWMIVSSSWPILAISGRTLMRQTLGENPIQHITWSKWNSIAVSMRYDSYEMSLANAYAAPVNGSKLAPWWTFLEMQTTFMWHVRMSSIFPFDPVVIWTINYISDDIGLGWPHILPLIRFEIVLFCVSWFGRLLIARNCFNSWMWSHDSIKPHHTSVFNIYFLLINTRSCPCSLSYWMYQYLSLSSSFYHNIIFYEPMFGFLTHASLVNTNCR